MMNPADNELLTRIGPGTAMGAMFRRGPKDRRLLTGCVRSECWIRFRLAAGRGSGYEPSYA